MPKTRSYFLPKYFTTITPITEKTGLEIPMSNVPRNGEIGKLLLVYSWMRMRSRVPYTKRMLNPLISLKKKRMLQNQVALAYFGPQTASLKVARLASFDVVLFKCKNVPSSASSNS